MATGKENIRTGVILVGFRDGKSYCHFWVYVFFVVSCLVFVAVQGFLIVVANRVYSLVARRGFQSARASVVAYIGSSLLFLNCSTGSRVVVHGLRYEHGILADQGMRTPVSCIGRRIFTFEPPGSLISGVLLLLRSCALEECSYQNQFS